MPVEQLDQAAIVGLGDLIDRRAGMAQELGCRRIEKGRCGGRQARSGEVGGDSVIDLPGTNQITVTGALGLTAADFLLA